MNRMPIVFAILAIAFASLACSITVDLPAIEYETGEMVTEEIVIPLPQDPSAVTNLQLAFGGGMLNLAPGARDALVSGSVAYNVEAFKPEVSASGDSVRIAQEDIRLDGLPDFLDGARNEWDLRLGAAPMNLAISAGAYRGKIELGGLALQELRLTEGASDTELSFSQPNLVEMDSLRYETGASRAELSGLANANFEDMTFRSGAGQYTLDFSGELKRNASVIVKSGLASISILVPEGTAAQVFLEGGLTNVDTDGAWQASGGEYVLSGEGPLLTIRVEMGAGNLELRHP